MPVVADGPDVVARGAPEAPHHGAEAVGQLPAVVRAPPHAGATVAGPGAAVIREVRGEHAEVLRREDLLPGGAVARQDDALIAAGHEETARHGLDRPERDADTAGHHAPAAAVVEQDRAVRPHRVDLVAHAGHGVERLRRSAGQGAPARPVPANHRAVVAHHVDAVLIVHAGAEEVAAGRRRHEGPAAAVVAPDVPSRAADEDVVRPGAHDRASVAGEIDVVGPLAAVVVKDLAIAGGPHVAPAGTPHAEEAALDVARGQAPALAIVVPEG